ncbi:MAG: DUF6785 family protein, partial [Candidatus Latescibacterota bacterium]
MTAPTPRRLASPGAQEAKPRGPQPAPAPEGASASGVTLRAVVTGGLLVAATSVLSPWAILMVQGSQLTSNAIPILAVLFLFLLTGVAVPLLKAWRRRWCFTRAELITIYAMLLVGSVVVTTGFTGSFLSVISGAAYYATPENEWADLFLPHVHAWLGPRDSQAIRLFYEGLPRGQSIPWSAWSTPLAAWVAFILVFYWVTLCLGVLLRGQWVDNERLVFPLTRLPLAMIEGTDEGEHLLARLYRNRLTYLGFAIPLVLHSWNSLNYYHDAFQRIALNGSVVLLQGLVSLPFRLNLPILGLAYLMPLNVSFSIWFFFLLGMVQQLVFARLGIQIGSGDLWNSGGSPPPLLH